MQKRKVKSVISMFLAAAMVLGGVPKLSLEASNVSVQAEEAEQDVRSVNFNKDWRFEVWLNAGENKRDYKENDAAIASPAYDDSGWRKLNLPHDWSIEQDFTSEVSVEYGALPTGIGWYRKKFALPAEDAHKRVSLDFGGVFANCELYVNGTKVGNYPYGYNSFTFDITDQLICDGETENVVAVKVNSPKNGSRWYTGSGIYRNVYLTVTDPVHVGYHGTAVSTPDLEAEYETGKVTVENQTTVENDGASAKTISVRNTILDYETGNVSDIAEPETGGAVVLEAGEKKEIHVSMTAQNPALWSVDSPNLYLMRTEILCDGAVIDSYDTRFGFRWMEFSGTEGFSLNGTWAKLQGVCMHHDQGALGSAAYEAAIYRQMKIMKEMGANAIRVTHNPADEALIRACDEIGLMVVEEAYDGWWTAKENGSLGYSPNFNKTCTHPEAEEGMTWGQFDFQQMIRKSRNSPSVIMWSVGNEVYGGDTGSRAVAWLNKAYEIREMEDPQERPLTMGENNFKRITSAPSGNREQMADMLEVVGLNYSEEQYDNLHYNWKPEWILYGSETASAVTSRGWYSDPQLTTGAQYIKDYNLSSYENSSVSWGRTATDAWTVDRDRKWIAGQFIWTGFDYIGEPSPFGSKGGSAASGPKSSFFGVVDTAGFAKDSYYLYQSQWLDVETDPMVHILPHWNWEDESLRKLVAVDGKIPVRVYSNAPAVELFVDGVSQGKKEFAQMETDYGYKYQQQSEDSDRLYLEWPLTWEYKQGTTIEAVAYDEQNRVIAKDTMTTAGKAAKLSAEADRTVIEADGYDLSYITVDVLDADGNFVPTADNEIYFHIQGNGKIVGVDNGDAASWERYQDYDGIWKRKAYSGKALVIVQSTEDAGSFTLTASGAGLSKDAVTVYTAKEEPQEDAVLGYETETMTVEAGILPEELSLPATVNAVLADGTKTPVEVSWELPDAGELAEPGELTVRGTADDGTDTAVEMLVVVKGVVGIQEISRVTGLNVKPQLPATVSVVWSDGSKEETSVVWDEISEEQLAEIGSTFDVKGTVADYPHMEAIAHIRVGEMKEQNVALPSNGGSVSGASVNENYAVRVIDNKWDQVDAWNTVGADDPKTGWVTLKFDQSYPIDTVKICPWKKAYSVPETVAVEYKNGNGEWKAVGNQSIDQAPALYSFSTITFDQIVTNELRFTFRTSSLTSGTSGLGVSEIQVYGSVAEAFDTAELSDLKVNGETVPGFDSKTLGYIYPLEYGSKVPEVKAAAKDRATCYVVQPVSANGTAMVEVTSESGKSTAYYTIQFSEKPPVLDQVTIENDFGEVVEDDVVELVLRGVMENGAEIEMSEAAVSWRVEDGSGHAQIRDGKLYAYDPGSVTIQATVIYEGVTCLSASVELIIQENAAEKYIVSFEDVRLRVVAGTKPELPAQVEASYNTGLPRKVDVTWDEIPGTAYASMGTFTVKGTVAGTSLQPSAQVTVAEAVAAQNMSGAIVEGYSAVLPNTTTVYYSDGVTEEAGIRWKEEPEGTDPKVYEGEVEGTQLTVTYTVRVANETKTSDNYVKKHNGWGLPEGLASYTNDDIADTGSDRATYLNDGIASFDNGGNKQIWCNYVKTARSEDWIAATIAVSGKIVNKMVDKVSFGLLAESVSWNPHLQIPKSYVVEYYTGPDYSDMLMERYTTDGIYGGGQMENEELWPDNPLTEDTNWKEVTYINKAELPSGNNDDWKRMLVTTFQPVETSLVRVRFQATENSCIGVNELEVYGTEAVKNSEIQNPKIFIDGKECSSSFENGKLEFPIEKDQGYPEITAQTDSNAAVTVVPATKVSPKAVVIFVPEDGSESGIQKYEIHFHETGQEGNEEEIQKLIKQADEAEETVAAAELTLEQAEKYASDAKENAAAAAADSQKAQESLSEAEASAREAESLAMLAETKAKEAEAYQNVAGEAAEKAKAYAQTAKAAAEESKKQWDNTKAAADAAAEAKDQAAEELEKVEGFLQQAKTEKEKAKKAAEEARAAVDTAKLDLTAAKLASEKAQNDLNESMDAFEKEVASVKEILRTVQSAAEAAREQAQAAAYGAVAAESQKILADAAATAAAAYRDRAEAAKKNADDKAQAEREVQEEIRKAQATVQKAEAELKAAQEKAQAKLNEAEKRFLEAENLRKESARLRFTSTQVKLKSIQVKGKMIKLSWKKVPSADVYVIQYGTKANFKGAKKLTVKKKTSANIKKLKKGKTYFMRVKAYQNVDGKKIYTKNSIKKKVHTRR